MLFAHSKAHEKVEMRFFIFRTSFPLLVFSQKGVKTNVKVRKKITHTTGRQYYASKNYFKRAINLKKKKNVKFSERKKILNIKTFFRSKKASVKKKQKERGGKVSP